MKTKSTWIIAVGLAACGVQEPGPNGQFGEEEQTICEVASRTPVVETDTVELWDGESTSTVLVADALALLGPTYTADLTWEATGETSLVATSFVSPRDVERVEYVYVDDDAEEGGPPVDPCPVRLELTVDVALGTMDGLLDEHFTTTAWSDGIVVGFEARVEAPDGTVDPVGLSVSDEPVQDGPIDVLAVVGGGEFSGFVAPVLAADPGGDVTPLGSWPGELE
ncbi:MAG: hypothetical protein KC656_13985 [Myxococcales bacterium]|nr:hypothetical protein [Myxococcales bacterium]MCB9670399.1 hypothetical protein [Alphaproteobacteria bacterium]